MALNFVILGSVGLGLGVIYFYKIWNSYSYWQKRGIKTPKFEFFYGNFRELNTNTLSSTFFKWTKMLGKTFGYYEGHLPILVTSDLDILQEIFIKQNTSFSARKRLPLMHHDNSKQVNLIFSTKARWKRMRCIMNPTFSMAKLRELGPLVVKCTDRLIGTVQNDNKEINVVNHYKRYTMDTIWNCAFGVDIDVQANPENDYFLKCERVFSDQGKLNPIMLFGVYFHEFKFAFVAFLESFFALTGKLFGVTPPPLWLRGKIGYLIHKRKTEKPLRKDYIQLLLDAQSDSKITGDNDLNDDESMDFTGMSINKKLTPEEINLNLVLFMLAGYETTSTTLSYCTYVLVKHPEEQQKLFDEISSFFGNASDESSIIEPNADNVGKLDYLDMFIKEVLRMYPIANSIVARRCTKPTTIKGLDIPLDMTICADVLSIHYDPELWGPIDPNVFYPQRFSPEIKRNPVAFLGFGVGPRNCIGMKFALLELKIALVKLLSTYEVKPTNNTPASLDYNEGIVRTPKDGVYAIFKKRQ